MLDWRTGEDEWEDIEEPRGPQAPRSPGPRSRPRWPLFLLAVLLTIIGGATFALRWKSQRQTARLRADIQATVDTESWARETHNLQLYRSLLDPAAQPGWRERQEQTFLATRGQVPVKMTVADAVLIDPNLAVVELEVAPPDRQPYRTTRAYRRSGGMWLETSIPNGQVWLDQATRETENLRFVFHQRDAARVIAVMPDIQRLYALVLNDLLLSPPQGKRTLYVILSVHPIESELADDPTYYDLSDLGPNADPAAIKRRLGALLLHRIMALFGTGRSDLSFLVQSVEEWELADWLGIPLPGSQVTSVQDLLISLPFVSLTDETWQSMKHPSARAVAGQALLDYIVNTYGRDKLTDIVRSAQRHNDWYSFVTQVLGVPFREFETGWRNYALHAFTQHRGTRLHQLPPEMFQLLADEQRAVEQGDLSLYESLLAENSDPGWRVQQRRLFATYQHFRKRTNAPFRIRVEDTVAQGDGALLRLEIRFPDPGSTPYQEIRTYHRFDGGWRWTSTLASFWGLTREEETTYLRFRYNRQDAEVVGDAMSATETFFLQAARDLAIRPSRRMKPVIEFIPDYRVLHWYAGPQQIRVLSPSLGTIITDMSPSDFYRLATGLALSRYLVDIPAGRLPTPFADAIYEAVARWETEQWAPVVPWRARRQQTLSALLRSGVRPSLRSRPTLTERRVDPIIRYLDDTAVAYLAETYGRDRLAGLVQQALQHDSWETLIPAVLEVEFPTFEAGWREYLGTHYRQR